MANFTFTITSAEEKAMESICVDIKEWGENAVKSRAAEAIQNITTRLIDHCNTNEIAIATGVEAQIDQAYSLGLIQKAEALSEPPELPE